MSERLEDEILVIYKSTYLYLYLTLLTDRHTDKRTQAKTFTSSLSEVTKVVIVLYDSADANRMKVSEVEHSAN